MKAEWNQAFKYHAVDQRTEITRAFDEDAEVRNAGLNMRPHPKQDNAKKNGEK